MKLICTYCREFKKKKDTKIYTELCRIGTSNFHIPSTYRICKKCGTEIYDLKLETKNLKNYIKQYKFIQKQQNKESKNAK
jgi:uncharacterized SAM-binding protein YcdF (DUF218 family)